MAGSTEITLTGILLTDPELQLTPTGAVARFTVAADEQRLDPATSRWVDTGTTVLPCSIGHHAAENVAESLTKGIRVLITGVLRQREWETTEGDKRYAYEVHAHEVAVSLNYATVRITDRESQQRCCFARRADSPHPAVLPTHDRRWVRYPILPVLAAQRGAYRAFHWASTSPRLSVSIRNLSWVAAWSFPASASRM